MQVIGVGILNQCILQHAEAKGQMSAWLNDAQHAAWKKPADVQERYGADVIVPPDRAVFNIKGKKYRIVARINYSRQLVEIRFAGPHSEYNRVDVKTV